MVNTYYIKQRLASFGAVMAVAGVASTLLSFFNYNLRLLMWIDMWGTTMGWIIRIALIAGGLALFFLLNTDEEEEENTTENK